MCTSDNYWGLYSPMIDGMGSCCCRSVRLFIDVSQTCDLYKVKCLYLICIVFGSSTSDDSNVDHHVTLTL